MIQSQSLSEQQKSDEIRAARVRAGVRGIRFPCCNIVPILNFCLISKTKEDMTVTNEFSTYI
jgi:hypothetical protein